MRKLVLGTSFALAAAFGAVLSPFKTVEAKPVKATFPVLISQMESESIPDADIPETDISETEVGVPEPEGNEVLEPTLEPLTGSADYYAFVDSFDGETLYARLPDGTTQPFTLPPGTGGIENYNLNPGDLVAINTGKDNVISAIDNPVIDTEFVGEVTSYDGVELVATSTTGEEKRAPVSQAVADRLEIQPGDEVKMTTFQNIEGMTSVCKVERAEATPPPPVEQPVFTPEPPPEPPIAAPEVRGLW